MKKYIALLLAVMLVVSMTACGKKEEAKTPLTDPLEKIVEDIYAKHPVEIGVVTMPVDITDVEWSLYSFTGLKSNENVKEAVASESMIGSIPYSLVLVRVNEGADAQAVAEEMKAGIDQRKWICVEADTKTAACTEDVAFLFMVNSDFADQVTTESMLEAFKAAVGTEVTVIG